jgi:hypothetical protein
MAAVLRGRAAHRLPARLAGQDEEGRQRLLARVSGSYRRGNERATARHPRNTW